MAFEILIKQQISRLQEPALECSHQVFEELRKILFLINIPEITRFDNLSTRIAEVMDHLLKRCLIPTDQMIKNLIEIELGHINTAHPEFINQTIFNPHSEEAKNDDLNKYEKKIDSKQDIQNPNKTAVNSNSNLKIYNQQNQNAQSNQIKEYNK